MGDVSLNRPIKAEPIAGGIAKGNRVLDTMSAGWTDERHMLYISSMEASFVDQLYNHGNHPHNNANGTPGFKVLRRGVWEYIKYEKTTNNAPARSAAKCFVPANPWIQHFRPRDCGSNGVEASVGDHESGTEASRKSLPVSVSHGREWEACKGEPQLLHESTEVSDQNFADDEAEVEAESVKACKKRRLSRTSPYRDE